MELRRQSEMQMQCDMFHGHDAEDQLMAPAKSESSGPNLKTWSPDLKLKGAYSKLGQRRMNALKPSPGNKWPIKRGPSRGSRMESAYTSPIFARSVVSLAVPTASMDPLPALGDPPQPQGGHRLLNSTATTSATVHVSRRSKVWSIYYL